MKKLLTLLISLLLSISVSSQTYEIDAYNGQTVTTCSGTFYDSGGVGGNYADGEIYTVTFCATTGVANLSFSSCTIAKNDVLTIYNGPNTLSPILYNITDGSFSPFVAQSTCGCITVRFTSNPNGNAAGWVATLGCSSSNDFAVNAITPPLNGTCLTGQSNVGSTADYTIGCFSSGNTVWYYIDLTGGANTISAVLQNATFANVEYVLMYDYTCVPFAGSSPGAFCGASGTTQQWTNLTEGIYWLGVSSAVEGTFDLCITQSYTDYCGDDFCGSAESCLTCFVDCGACAEAEGGPYYHPIAGRQYTYVGQCMVTTCSGTYYDNGGPGVNYANNINQIYRTFCPNEAGDAISVSFSELGIGAGDWLTVQNGPTQNSPVIWQGRGNLPTPITSAGVWSNPITSTHSSGCLTFRFTSNAVTNALGWTANLSCVPHPLGLGPNDTYNNDCSRATPICDDITIQSEVWGPGLESEGCGSCVTSENWTEWYWVRVQTGGTMQFEITPQGGSDMDFAIYKANSCDNLGSPLRCSYAAYVAPGKTGLSLAAGDLSEDVKGDQWVAELNIVAGEIYVIMINEWYKTNPNAYNIDFTLTNGASFDCAIVLPVELISFSGERISEKEIDLHWKTASETNNDKFEVQRKIDNKFKTIGDVHGSGNSNMIIDYKYVDETATKETEYYRLKQVDFDGRYEYSNVISVDSYYDENSKHIYPNPVMVGEKWTILGLNDNDTYKIFDITGNIIDKNSELSQGMYIVVINENIYLKLVVK